MSKVNLVDFFGGAYPAARIVDACAISDPAKRMEKMMALIDELFITPQKPEQSLVVMLLVSFLDVIDVFKEQASRTDIDRLALIALELSATATEKRVVDNLRVVN